MVSLSAEKNTLCIYKRNIRCKRRVVLLISYDLVHLMERVLDQFSSCCKKQGRTIISGRRTPVVPSRRRGPPQRTTDGPSRARATLPSQGSVYEITLALGLLPFCWYSNHVSHVLQPPFTFFLLRTRRHRRGCVNRIVSPAPSVYLLVHLRNLDRSTMTRKRNDLIPQVV